MKLIKTIYAAAIFLIVCTPSILFAQQVDYFPLTEGNTWIYGGTVKWTDSVNTVKEKKISLKMIVEKRIKNGQFEIAIMKGYPDDLCWYEPGRKPSRYLIVWKDNKYYRIQIHGDTDKLTKDESYLSSKINYNNLFLVDPLKEGLEFGNDPDIQREDTFYSWLVEKVQKDSLSGVVGILSRKNYNKYTLIYRTMPEHEIVEFVPFVGITGYIFQHHGTVSEVNVTLIQFIKK